ncbi:MAG: ParA family protein [Phycisphaerae bacterium]
MRTIAVINQKGGVGKTTTVANLGSGIAAEGYDVCLVDMDPQSHLTLHFGVEPGTPGNSLYELLVEGATVMQTIMHISPRLGLIPATIDLAAAEVELVTSVGREKILADKLAATSLPDEYMIIDCPPSLGLLTLNALAAADEVIIPLQPHFLALQGLGKLLETVSLVKQRINPRLKVSGVLLCMFEKQTNLASEVVSDLEEFFSAARGKDVPWSDTRIFESRIRRNVKLAECPSYGNTIFEYAPSSNGAVDYYDLVMEFIETFPPERPPIEEIDDEETDELVNAHDLQTEPAAVEGMQEAAAASESPDEDEADSSAEGFEETDDASAPPRPEQG